MACNITDDLDQILSITQTIFNNKRQIKTQDMQKIQTHIHEAKNKIINSITPLIAKLSAQHSMTPDQKQPSQSAIHIAPKSYASAAAQMTPRSTIVLRPNNGSEAKAPEVEQQITTLLKQKHIEANIHTTTSTKKGNIVLKLDPKDPIADIAESITDNLKFVASSRPALLPKMTVSHVPSHYDSDALTSQIKQSNPWLEFSPDSFEILFLYKVKDYNSAVIRISPENRDSVAEHNFQLKVGARVCPIRDRFYVRICSNCSKIGHGTKACKQEAPTCSICAESHVTKDCPHKNEPNKTKCTNCQHTDDDSLHRATDDCCPRIVRSKISIIKNTQWGKTMPNW